MKYSFEDIDERMIKTRSALSNAILNLIKKEDKIKVLDICHEANITPMTYYHHFNNKTQLLEFAINVQLAGILPIPRKLKPISLKHLIYYLIYSFNKFIKENRKLIYCAIKQANENRYMDSYIYLMNKLIKALVKQEIKLLVKANDLYIELLSNIICGSIIQLSQQIIMDKIDVSSSTIWEFVKNITFNLNIQ